ncbi:HD domain-containing protein, partial [Paenibacillus tyrfis]|uniref:HD domain-containing protein n=1 Tax=Paenibacillus tyrfis TaxID=1501230 RepID=UPI00209DA375
VPDSSLCKKATELVLELSPKFLFNHCLRTYKFGGLLAQREAMKFDPELFYLGAIFHDLGLTERCDHGHSFEVDSANAADEFLTHHGYPKEKIDIVREAIVLHTSVLAEEKQPEIALVHFGAGFDVGAFH